MVVCPVEGASIGAGSGGFGSRNFEYYYFLLSLRVCFGRVLRRAACAVWSRDTELSGLGHNNKYLIGRRRHVVGITVGVLFLTFSPPPPARIPLPSPKTTVKINPKPTAAAAGIMFLYTTYRVFSGKFRPKTRTSGPRTTT